MKLLSDFEKGVFAKYIKPRVVDKEDEGVLDRYASIGFVGFGFNWNTMQEIAFLTKSGMLHRNR